MRGGAPDAAPHAGRARGAQAQLGQGEVPAGREQRGGAARSCSASGACGRIARPAHGAPRGARELVLAAVAAVGRDGGRVAARLALRDAREHGGAGCRPRLRAVRRRSGRARRASRPDDAVDREAVGALEARGWRGASAARRRRRPGSRARAGPPTTSMPRRRAALLWPPVPWTRPSPPPASGERRAQHGDAAAAPAHRGAARRAASARRRARAPLGREPGIAERTDRLSARVNLAGHHAYGVS